MKTDQEDENVDAIPLDNCRWCLELGNFASRWRYVGGESKRLSLWVQCEQGGPPCFIAQGKTAEECAKIWNDEQRRKQ